jgi:hypothetical protein
VFLQAKDQGLSIAREVAEVMATAKGWDAARVDVEVARYERLVAASRAYQAGRALPVG